MNIHIYIGFSNIFKPLKTNSYSNITSDQIIITIYNNKNSNDN